ncbi:MAG: flagellar assembly protein FliH [Pseudomonadota bacterium]
MSDGAAKPWDVPAIDGGDGRGYMTAARLEALQDEAYQEGFNRGVEDGKAEGLKEMQLRCKRLDELIGALSAPFRDLDQEVEEQVVGLAMAVARQLFRREMHIDPSHVIGVVRDAIQLLPVASQSIEIHLHPDDAALVRESLKLSDTQAAWTIVEEPLITRGGCRVSTDTSHVDATAESRLNAVIASVAGDERST